MEIIYDMLHAWTAAGVKKFPHKQSALAPNVCPLKPSHFERNWNGITHLGAQLDKLVET